VSADLSQFLGRRIIRKHSVVLWRGLNQFAGNRITLEAQVLALVSKGRSYRLIGREVGLSKNTVAEIVKRRRATAAQIT
jgi:hypothetical protein